MSDLTLYFPIQNMTIFHRWQDDNRDRLQVGRVGRTHVGAGGLVWGACIPSTNGDDRSAVRRTLLAAFCARCGSWGPVRGAQRGGRLGRASEQSGVRFHGCRLRHEQDVGGSSAG